MTFKDLRIGERLLDALRNKGYNEPTAIQEKVIPAVLDRRDVLGCATTGTGKTGAFLIPMVENLSEKGPAMNVRALILSPTRELAQQIGEVLSDIASGSGLRHAIIYGGVPVEDQIEVLANGVDVVIATPGRLVDLSGRGAISLSGVEMLVLDEADRMLDMGFTEDITRIAAELPANRQTLMLSATMPEAVRQLGRELLNEPIELETAPVASTAELIEQKVYYIEPHNKNMLLMDLLRKAGVESAVVFTKTRRSADALNEFLQGAGFKCDRLHSDRSQHARDTILEAFRKQELPILIATDIASRGIDVSHITHVFNYELPQEAETYIHRVGRTGRAGRDGIAITLCAPDEKAMLIQIQKLMKKHIPVVDNHTYATLSLRQALQQADDKMAGKAEKKKGYKGNKANGDFFRRQKMAKKKG